MHHNAITVHHLTYAYPDGTQALQDISFKIHPSERVALVGANGSGKSTFLLHLNGILAPQSGSITIGEWPLEPAFLKQIRNFVGLVFQNPDDQIFMTTVWDDIAFGLVNQGIPEPTLRWRVQQAMEAVNLDPVRYRDRNPHHLSGGEKKRVAIAGVLAMNPQVLVLDEPSAQLDPRSRRQLIQLLDDLPETQIIATHDLDLALDLCSRTIVLNQGRVVFDGDTESVLTNIPFLQEHALESPLCYSRLCFTGLSPTRP
jgi:cobalt/nickel transport system ATP-binding protein